MSDESTMRAFPLCHRSIRSKIFALSRPRVRAGLPSRKSITCASGNADSNCERTAAVSAFEVIPPAAFSGSLTRKKSLVWRFCAPGIRCKSSPAIPPTPFKCWDRVTPSFPRTGKTGPQDPPGCGAARSAGQAASARIIFFAAAIWNFCSTPRKKSIGPRKFPPYLGCAGAGTVEAFTCAAPARGGLAVPSARLNCQPAC